MRRRVREFFGDGLGTLVKNAGTLLSGNVVAAILELITVTLAARSLGPIQFGTLVVLQSYSGLIDRVINFQSWQAIIKYGSDAVRSESPNKIVLLTRLSMRLDGLTAILASVVAMSLAPLAGYILAWDASTTTLAFYFSVSLMANWSGTPIGLLRLFNKFRLLALHRVVVAGFRMLGVIGIIATDAELVGFVLVWVSASVLGHILLFATGLWVLSSYRGKAFERISEVAFLRKGVRVKAFSEFPGIIRFFVFTNLNSATKTAARELDVLIISGILGPAQSGLYRIAKQFAGGIGQAIDPLYQAVFPQLASLSASVDRRAFKSLIVRSGILAGLMAGGALLLFGVGGDEIIRWTVGPQYLDAQSVLLWYLTGLTVAYATISLQPAVVALGRPDVSLGVHLFSTVSYLTAIVALTRTFGLEGAGVAFLLYYLLWGLLMTVAIVQISRSVETQSDYPL